MAPTSRIGPSAQVTKFGAEMVLARDVVGFESRGPVRAVLFEDSEEIESRALVVATGMSYRRLQAGGLSDLTGRGVYYGAAVGEANQCQGDVVYVVGAANSAGQAALELAGFAKQVVLVVRSCHAHRDHVVVPDRAESPRRQHRGAVPQQKSWRPTAPATWSR